MTVYDLKVGQRGTINNINGNEKLAKRLLALGCINNTEIEVKKVAPLGDPIVVRFRGLDLAIRKSDAKNITLK
ncbi:MULTISPECIES: FeoA family protein [Romboutsia]|uniref:FeoA domain n=1 Tax=Romboutsia hominis TaxID=1507512 RepID=A0A2P2BMQ3_9FIRM|nr:MULTISPECIES: ferrous iron transport protein A [Romboutsia]MCH1958643.1 ferrous iron transport protein A [Romboutsia hominis]MCH1970559.1 ferrous iron transport protein A [Romboutsia hominis]MDB8789254.1 ferrous iron transport protein A [Romboutsia sp. 1001216sp1]MDB8802170.1 ferrous iron transport protein A [Romboutsia sp. 1001216sp1]MDB8805376.1 ferrous iron transport protein A [Romboutsia sp. 1001216sp1]